jgi:hypothetical protein
MAEQGTLFHQIIELTSINKARTRGNSQPHPSRRLGVAAGGGDAAEVTVLEPVAVALEGDDLGVVDEPVDHGPLYLDPTRLLGCHLRMCVVDGCPGHVIPPSASAR